MSFLFHNDDFLLASNKLHLFISEYLGSSILVTVAKTPKT